LGIALRKGNEALLCAQDVQQGFLFFCFGYRPPDGQRSLAVRTGRTAGLFAFLFRTEEAMLAVLQGSSPLSLY
jgi:hypothetical protein